MAIYSKKYLSDILKRDANNFDILRLFAAISVIIGHAYAINPQPPLADGVLTIIHFDFSGEVAVKFFFFLSGLLVTNSIISNPDVVQFLIKRVFRIFPGLFVCLLVSVFIVGPIFTKVSLREYFSAPDTWNYIRINFLLYDMQWRLTGVFTDSKYGLNGSLWTLFFEMLCYLYLAFVCVTGLFKNKLIANIFILFIISISLFIPTHLPAFFSSNPNDYFLLACFSVGAFFANNKQSININFYLFILFWLFTIGTCYYYAPNCPIVYQFIFYVALFYAALYISSIDFVIKYLKLPYDGSYGIYIYGFVIQQCVHAMLPAIGVHGNQIVSILIAIVVGTLSWHFVEKPFVKIGLRLSNSDNLIELKRRAISIFKSKNKQG
jgi:peptidoglycan/LPS O-acetylase OafA/YrhL